MATNLINDPIALYPVHKEPLHVLLNSSPQPSLPEGVQNGVDLRSPHNFTVHLQLKKYARPELIQVAWAIILSKYLSSEEVSFWSNTVQPEMHDISGLVPIRLQLQAGGCVSDILRQLEMKRPPDVERRVHDNMDGFQSALLVNPPAGLLERDVMALLPQGCLVIISQIQTSSMTQTIHFDTKFIHSTTAQRILEQHAHILSQLGGNTNALLGDLNLVSPRDLQDLDEWHTEIPIRLDECVHDLIQQTCARQPEAIAVSAWDGDLSYTELGRLSSRLAAHLAGLGVGPECIVPLCFEKSKWAIVAMMGVIKAGGAYVFLDPTYPIKRLQTICNEIKPRVILVSSQHPSYCTTLANDVVVVNETSVFWTDHMSDWEGSSAKPDSLLYAVFTSGSTGIPKGVLMEHAAFCTNAKAMCNAAGLGPHTRVFQFASFTYDVSNRDILTTLIAGGCVCLPSEFDRKNDIAGFIKRYQVNWASLTPSVVGLLDPASIPSLKHLVLCGEAGTETNKKMWAENLNLLNAYGPCECAGISSIAKVEGSCHIRNIGQPVGSASWLVDPTDHTKLAPVGAVGELIIEGATVGRGYLNNPQITAAGFIKCPPWRHQFSARLHGRLYKTGDLGQYTSDGTIIYLGRKDKQVKIRGQRVELGEVEHQIQECLRDVRDIVKSSIVDVHPASAESNTQLVAFLDFGEERIQRDGVDIPTVSTRQAEVYTQSLRSRLAKSLPDYMIPSVFIPLNGIPLTLSGKINRSKLQEIARTVLGGTESLDDRTEIRTETSLTTAEIKMRDLWANVLPRNQENIHTRANFFRLGGDSITAMKLTGLARDVGLQLTVVDVFTYPELRDLTRIAQETWQDAADAIPPFSLLREDTSKLRRLAAKMCAVDESQIEDMYPCTAMQEGLITLTSHTPGAYVEQFVYELPLGTDHERLKKAWDQVVEVNAILQTRIIQGGSGMVQVVIKRDASWTKEPDLDTYLAQDKKVPMGVASRLARVCISGSEKEPGRSFLVVTIHHALYDGWSWPLILEQVEKAYHGDRLESRPFNCFIRYIYQSDMVASTQFWKSQFDGLSAPSFPPPTASTSSRHTLSLKHSIPSLSAACSEFTLTSIIRLAWAKIVSQYTESDDVVFGVTLAGRNAPVVGIDRVTGPTITTLPLRVQLNSEQSIAELLSVMQKQTIAMIPHEQTGLRTISRLGENAAAACGFQTLLVIQPADGTEVLQMLKSDKRRDSHSKSAFDTYPLTLLCQVGGNNSVTVEARFDTAVMTEFQMERILHQFGRVIKQTSENQMQRVGEISLLGPEDYDQLQVWSHKTIIHNQVCTHELIRERCLEHPEATAVSAWDGELSYGELDNLSQKLALYLIKQGVAPEVFVPLCFDKSKWAIVAILGVMKAGGAFVALDSSFPMDRLKKICQGCNATLVICSENNAIIGSSLAPTVVTVGPALANWSDSGETGIISTVQPHNAIYAIFTSGSTGEPKGIVIEHTSLSSSLKAQIPRLGLNRNTRALQFASYAFDASIDEQLGSLVAGGCICVPSEEERKADLIGAINRLRVNWLMLTPSVARLLYPEAVPTVRTIVLVGEAISQEDIATWANAVDLINAYGPTECTVCATSKYITGPVSDFRSIGHAFGANLVHIVDRNDHNKLLPIGMVGELVIEGPIVGRGYLNDPTKTRSAFLDNTTWLQRLDRDQSWRLYKTGDLAQYNADGSINYLGRKDTAVKLHGQRLELQDVEHQLRRFLDNSSFLVADIVLQGNNPILAAFVLFGDEADHKGPLFGEKDAPFCAEVAKAQAHMKQRLPIYMVPTAFIPLARVPLTKTGKTDRRTLRSEAAKLPRHEILEYGVMQQGAKAAVKLNPDETVALQVSQKLVQLTADQSATEWLQDRDVNLSQAGLDSIDTMSLSMFIRKTFGVVLPPGKLNNSAVTVREIARYIEAATGATPTEDLFDTVDLLAEVEALNTQLARLHDPNAAPPSIKAPRVFFITGGTGFLGSEILRQLLIRPQTTKVIVHVRARNQEDAMARIIHSARVGQWWHEDLQSRLEVWAGDLSQPQLGLEDRLWTYLSGKTRDKKPVDAIIHCGAAVYWEADYMALKAANVTSTFDLLALIGQSPDAPRFTFVSGGRLEMEEIDDRSAAVNLSQSSGYSQTKFVAELLVKEYIKRQPDCRVTVLKPALIVGDADRGVSNTDDFIWRAVAAAIRVGGFNSCENDAWMAVAGVDQVAAEVIGMCLQNEPGVVHLLDGISLGDFWSTVCHNLPFNLTPMEADKWLQEVQEDVERSGQDHVLWPVLNWLESGGGYLGFPQPLKYNPRLDGGLIKASVRASILYLKDVGYLAGRGAAACTTSLVFKRSGRGSS
ncbi:AMP-binding enzyme [Aspergillus parasiticus SU-1]|uniref:AMP-binding enzyme n=1 Tax=Aspergillus parasiticus (strain ATCC 56775 / NRRL 5862 / SRRC 143 / SU-1) TaxID=1403190 RepID=A0A0F0IAJ8_ASPPU|nr:AMP-binding enzyme [Aspergillus parasiticus SU-1]